MCFAIDVDTDSPKSANQQNQQRYGQVEKKVDAHGLAKLCHNIADSADLLIWIPVIDVDR